MSKVDDGGPAFPMYSEIGNLHSEGVSIRDYFAATIDIPWGLVEAYAGNKGDVSYEQLIKWRAQMRYAEADAMLRERAKAQSEVA